MSIIYCDICDKNIDTDYAAEHFDSHTEEVRLLTSRANHDIETINYHWYNCVLECSKE